MEEPARILIVLGLLFLAGLAADVIGRRTHLPRVTLLLGCGLVVGQAGFDLIPAVLGELYELVAIIALTMIAFLLGGSLSLPTLRAHGRSIVVISLAVVLVTLIGVACGLTALGLDLPTALVLGAIATATDPAATLDVIRQTRSKGGFTETLKGIVAIDDAWGLIVFSLVLVLATGDGAETGLLRGTLIEISGSVALGLAVGLPGAVLTGRLSGGEPLRIEALGLVFLTAGFALWLELSYLIAGMTAGAIIVNLARHHTRAFHEIEHIQWPYLIVFFILAGASLDLGVLWTVGEIGLAYVVLRILSRVAGGWLGARMVQAPLRERIWYGPALLPQAGVAVGVALVAADHMPHAAAEIMALTIGATVVFELIGPVIAAVAIRRVGPG